MEIPCSWMKQIQKTLLVEVISQFISQFMPGWWYTYPSEKYEFVSWDDEIPNIWKNKKCSKPPTRCWLFQML